MPDAGPLIAIADDHPLMRAALASSLAACTPGVRFVEASDVTSTMSVVSGDPAPDLLLMDLHMPGADGLAGVRSVRALAPHVPVAVVSAEDDRHVVAQLLALGVSGFIPKTDSPGVVASAVRLILAGGTYVPPHLLRGDTAAPVATSSGLTAAADGRRAAACARPVEQGDRARARRERRNRQGALARRVPRARRAQSHGGRARGAAFPRLTSER